MRTGLLLALLILAAGCGGGSGATSDTEVTRAEPARATTTTTAAKPPAANPFPDDPQILARATTQTQRRSLELLARDVVAMRAASSHAPAHTLKGTAATRRTTSRFIDHLGASTIDDLSKNRLIDHAAAAVATTCDQCFQQLESIRPIPAIAH